LTLNPNEAPDNLTTILIVEKLLFATSDKNNLGAAAGFFDPMEP